MAAAESANTTLSAAGRAPGLTEPLATHWRRTPSATTNHNQSARKKTKRNSHGRRTGWVHGSVLRLKARRVGAIIRRGLAPEMSIPLEKARLCLDCDTVFEEARCPSCSGETYFPLSRWVRPAMVSAEVPRKTSKKVRNTSLLLLGGGLAYGIWKLLGNSARQSSDKKEKPDS
jgi:hypothetical protein